ncbi:hypothetical protein FACS189447_03130 [Spirochaetia bacterium]|nr:hypothetical protein FACS189447_03130 [Spirochaetia bacterium]
MLTKEQMKEYNAAYRAKNREALNRAKREKKRAAYMKKPITKSEPIVDSKDLRGFIAPWPGVMRGYGPITREM